MKNIIKIKIEIQNDLFFISKNSFLQNVFVAKMIRKYILNFLENVNCCKDDLVCIGGESYFIGIASVFKNIINYTNSQWIYDDVNFNNKFYKKIKENYLVDYNEISQIYKSEMLMINIARLNTNLLKIINEINYKKIIITSCHHNDFWKRTKLLTRYTLVSRKVFIAKINFITVNIFIRKNNYISLGPNCAVSYQLNKLNLRNISYPFDWCKLSIKQLNNVLENEFSEFNNVMIKKYSENHPSLNGEPKGPNGSLILKNSYGITFAHELVNKMDILEFKEKLKKRITLFKNLKDPTFIIIVNDRQNDEIKKLRYNLQIYFKNFKIILVNKNKNNEYNSQFDWRLECIDWKSIVIYN